MIFVDSSVWIDYFNGKQTWQTDQLDDLLRQELVFIGDIVLAEVLQGFRKDDHFRRARKVLNMLPCVDLCGKGIAIKSAENFRALRKQGITVRKTIDMLIGTFCCENDYVLLHNDSDFDAMASHLRLRVVKQEHATDE